MPGAGRRVGRRWEFPLVGQRHSFASAYFTPPGLVHPAAAAAAATATAARAPRMHSWGKPSFTLSDRAAHRDSAAASR